MRQRTLSLAVGLLLACSPSGPEPATTGITSAATLPSKKELVGGPLGSFVGQCVRVTGYAAGAKIGPQLLTGRAKIWVMPRPGEKMWGDLPGGARVEVRGVVRERSDLPVFVRKPGEPIMAGMEVPEGTDLEAARRRLVIEEPSVTVLRPIADVERDLKSAVGTDVSLDGVVFSLNDHVWFNHEGVEVHLERRDGSPDVSKLHGEAATLRGKLERKPMPRLDQIIVKPQPDLADAYVLSLESAAPHPGWAVEGC